MAKAKEKAKVQAGKAEKAVTREELETAAYFSWLNRGCPPGDALTDWAEAEKWAAGSSGRD